MLGCGASAVPHPPRRGSPGEMRIAAGISALPTATCEVCHGTPWLAIVHDLTVTLVTIARAVTPARSGIRERKTAATRYGDDLLASLRPYFHGVTAASDDDRRGRNTSNVPVDVDAMAVRGARQDEHALRPIDRGKTRVGLAV
jgi:hypothetical protein